MSNIDLSTLTIDQILALQAELTARKAEADLARKTALAEQLQDVVTDMVTSGIAPTKAKSGSVYFAESQIPVTIDGTLYHVNVSAFDVEASKKGKAAVKAAEKAATQEPANA